MLNTSKIKPTVNVMRVSVFNAIDIHKGWPQHPTNMIHVNCFPK